MNELQLRRLLIVLLLYMAFLPSSRAQIDTEFWFVAPEITQTHGDAPVILRLATLGKAATVKISMPANSAFQPITVSIAANSLSTVDLTTFKDQIENGDADKISNKGILITSTEDITAYYEVNTACRCNPDIFPLKGKNALGNSFLLPFQTFWFNMEFPILARSGFDIVAVENNTKVTITNTKAIVGHSAGSTFTITLQKGQTYSGVATGGAPADRPAGSTIKSDKPIAITIKDDSMTHPDYGGCGDLMGDQIVPTALAGKKYIVMKGFLKTKTGADGPDRVFILATEDGTTVKMGNVDQPETLSRGATLQLLITSPSTFIETSKPVLVLHITGFGCEVGGSLLPSLECTGSNQVSFARSTDESFSLNIMVKKTGADGFRLNGNAAAIPASVFSEVPGTNGEWVSAQIQTNALGAEQAATLVNSKELFHLGLINGGSNTGCRYGYFSNYGSFRLEAETNSPVCPGGTIELKANAKPGDVVSWTGPSGFKSSDFNPSIPNASNTTAGTYVITATRGLCQSEPTELKVEILNTPVPKLEISAPKNAICLGDILSFTAKGTNFPDNIIPSFQWMINGQPKGTNASTFSTNELKDKDKVSLKVKLAGASKICIEEEILSQELQIAVASADAPTVSIEADALSVCTGDTVEFKATFANAGQPTFNWKVNGQPKGTASTFLLLAQHNDKVVLEIKSSLECASVNTATSNEITIEVKERTPYPFANNYSYCPDEEDGVALDAGPAASYDWQPLGLETQNVLLTEGQHTVTITLSNGCQHIGRINVAGICKMAVFVPDAFTPNGDGVNDEFKLFGRYVKKLDFKLYNRWGELIFAADDLADTWNGVYLGKEVPMGAYFWYLKAEANDPSQPLVEMKGELNVIR